MNQKEGNDYLFDLIQNKVKPGSETEEMALAKFKQCIETERDLRDRVSTLSTELDAAKVRLNGLAGAREALSQILVEAEAKRRSTVKDLHVVKEAKEAKDSTDIKKAVESALGVKVDSAEVVNARHKTKEG